MNVLKIIFVCLLVEVTDNTVNALQCALCKDADQLCPQLLIAECPSERNYQCVDVYWKPTDDYPKGRLEKFCMNKYYNCPVQDGICTGCLGSLCNSGTTLESYYKRYINISKTNKEINTSRNVEGLITDGGIVNKHKVYIPSVNDILRGSSSSASRVIVFDSANGVNGDGTDGRTKETTAFANSTTRNNESAIKEGANKISGGSTAESVGVTETSNGGGNKKGIFSWILGLSRDSTTETTGSGEKGGVGFGFRLNLGRFGGLAFSLGTVKHP